MNISIWSLRIQAKVVLLSSIFLLITFGQSHERSDRILAKVGNSVITEQEFKLRFELMPGLNRHRKTNLQRAKLELIYSMIAEKLLAEEAFSHNIHLTYEFKEAFGDVRKMLARDQLYREEVADKIQISGEEVIREIEKARHEVFVEFIYTPEKESASFLRKLLFDDGSNFHSLSIDSSMMVVRDTATIIWSDADSAIAQAAYELNLGNVSQVLRAGDGYYIIRKARVGGSAHFLSLPSETLRNQVEKVLRNRKERERAEHFVRDALKERSGFAKIDLFNQFEHVFGNILRKSFSDEDYWVSDHVYGEMKNVLHRLMQDTLAVAGSHAWTVNDVLDMLYKKSFRIPRKEIKRLPYFLNAEIQTMVQQELLAQIALERSLDQKKEIRDMLQMWYAQHLAEYLKATLQEQVKVTDADVRKYLLQEDDFLTHNYMIRELESASADLMNNAASLLYEGMTFDSVAAMLSTEYPHEVELIERGPISPEETGKLAEILSRMKEGEWFGPIVKEEKLVILILLKKSISHTMLDKLDKVRIEEDILQMKQKRSLDLFLSEVAMRRGFEIFPEQLESLEVSAVPMLTYRFLGFGGRMFAVPIVDFQVDWVNLLPDAITIP